MTARGLLSAAALAAAIGAGPAGAHETRPAYLAAAADPAGRIEVLWKTPARGGEPLRVEVRFPADCRTIAGPHVRSLEDVRIERSVIDCGAQGLAGRRVEFAGLEATITDVLVRVESAGGAASTTLVRPSRPWMEVPAEPGWGQVLRTYGLHGVEHILLGSDHLLFVLALMILVRGPLALVATITAFTAAHSITLAAATLGGFRPPVPPVEAAIALSIVLVAVEIERMRRGEASLAGRRPWAIAFAFGLLHGFGFAGALSSIGLPRGDIPLALLAFNVGVEAGQLLFVAAILVVLAALKPLRSAWTSWAGPAPAYAVGTTAAFWFFERLAAFAT